MGLWRGLTTCRSALTRSPTLGCGGLSRPITPRSAGPVTRSGAVRHFPGFLTNTDAEPVEASPDEWGPHTCIRSGRKPTLVALACRDKALGTSGGHRAIPQATPVRAHRR